jgi:hypothetical protein
MAIFDLAPRPNCWGLNLPFLPNGRTHHSYSRDQKRIAITQGIGPFVTPQVGQAEYTLVRRVVCSRQFYEPSIAITLNYSI